MSAREAMRYSNLACRRAVLAAGHAPCVQCGGTGNELLTVYRTCCLCDGWGRWHEVAGLVACDNGERHRAECPLADVFPKAQPRRRAA